MERPFQYVEGNRLKARDFETRSDLDAHAIWWMDNTSDLHVHDTTGERPIDRFEREKDFLLPMPAHPYDTADVAYRVVSDDAVVRWEDVRYSVPAAHVLDVVVVRATEHEVFVYSSDLRVLARHTRAPRGHRDPVIDQAHRPLRRSRHDVEALAARLGELGDAAARFAAGLCNGQRYRGQHLADTLALVDRYDAEDLVCAIERAFDAGVVARILATTATPRAPVHLRCTRPQASPRTWCRPRCAPAFAQ